MAEPFDPHKTQAMMHALRTVGSAMQAHPVASAAAGMIPGVGQAAAATETAAALADPNASMGQVGMAALGAIPGFKFLRLGKQAAMADALRTPFADASAAVMRADSPNLAAEAAAKAKELERTYLQTGDESFLQQADFWRRFSE